MNRRFSMVLLVVLLVAAVPVFASHAWGTYHWSRTSTQITPPVHNNVSSVWDPYLDVAVADWNASSVIQSPYGSAYGPISSTSRCSSATGKIEVCNRTYGQNGWLGIAGISISGGHITKGYTKLNDTYFNTATYNKPSWRRMVTCQEIGHDYGLAHVNENFNDPNTGSCMDYTNDPARNDGAGTNEYPNAHDYSLLESIYNHSHALALPFDEMRADATRPTTIQEFMAKADQWGEPIAFDQEGRPTTFFLRTGPNHGGEMHDGEIIDVFWAPFDPFAEGADRDPEAQPRQ